LHIHSDKKRGSDATTGAKGQKANKKMVKEMKDVIQEQFTQLE